MAVFVDSKIIINKLHQLLPYILLALFLYGCTDSNTAISEPILSTVLDEKTHIAYQQGKGILLFYYHKKNTAQQTNQETYADWAAYLNDFKEETGDDFFIQEAEPNTLTLLTQKASTELGFNLFIKKGKSTFYYNDLIVEPQVYQAVINSYKGKALTEEDKAFIPEIITLNVSK